MVAVDQKVGKAERREGEHPTITLFKVLRKQIAYVRSFVGKGYADVEGLGKAGKGCRAYNVYPSRGKTDQKGWNRDQWDRLLLELARQNTAEIKLSKAYPYQAGGFCPYAVINNGGHNSGDISDCPALFIEFDEPITKAEALAKIRDFKLPPTIIIESRKGFHIYWRLEKNTTVDIWRSFQWRLIEQFESDACIEDPSRVMRLPGFYHLKAGEDPFLVSIKYLEETNEYSIEDFDRVLPPVPKWRLKLDKAEGSWGTSQEVQLDNGLGFWDIRDFKHVLKHYVENGRREYDTCQCPVHSKDKRDHSTDSLHIHHDTGKYKCHGGCDPQDIYAEVCRLAGVSKFRVVDASAINASQNVNENKELNENRKRLETTIRDVSYDLLINNIRKIIDEGVTDETELEIRLNNLCSEIYGNSSPYYQNQLKEQYNRELQRDSEESILERKKAIEETSKLIADKRAKQSIPFEEKCSSLLQLFKQSSLNGFLDFCINNNYELYPAICALLSCANTSKKAGTRLKSNNFGEFATSLMVWLIGKPSSGKSKTLDLVMKALENETIEARLQYNKNLEDLKKEQQKIRDMKQRGEPITDQEIEKLSEKISKPQIYVINDTTEEGLAEKLADQDRGCIIGSHEMSVTASTTIKNSGKSGMPLLQSHVKGFDALGENQGRKSAKETVGSLDFGSLVAVQPDLVKAFLNLDSSGGGLESRLIMCKIPFRDIELPTGEGLPATEEEAEKINDEQGELTDYNKMQLTVMNAYKLIRQRCNSKTFRFNEFQNSAFIELQQKRISLRNALAKNSTPVAIARARVYDMIAPRIAFTLHILFESLEGFHIDYETRTMLPTMEGSLEISKNIKDKYVRAALELCQVMDDELDSFYDGTAFIDGFETEESEAELHRQMVEAIIRKCDRSNNKGLTHREFVHNAPFNKLPNNRYQMVRDIMDAMVATGQGRYDGKKFYLN